MARGDFKLLNDVPIVDINLDPENARIRSGTNQQSCIDKVLRKSEQVFVLIKDILTDGLTISPIIVTTDTTEANKYLVKDGNRRVTALKLLNDPSLCKDEVMRERIINLLATSNSPPLAIDCYFSDNQVAITKEVLARHSGEQRGAGQVNWSPYLRTIYLLNNGQSAGDKRSAQYCLWSEEHGIFIDDDFPITNITRFMNVENLEFMGFEIFEDNLKAVLPEDIIISIARRIIHDFSSGIKKVQDIWTDEKAKAYLTEVRLSLGLPATPKPKPSSSPNPSYQQSGENNQESDGYTSNDGEEKHNNTEPNDPTPKPKPRPIKPAWDRKKLFHNGSPRPLVPTQYPKARTVVSEIGSLSVDKTPLATAMLLRALIELSTEHYLSEKSLKTTAS